MHKHKCTNNTSIGNWHTYRRTLAWCDKPGSEPAPLALTIVFFSILALFSAGFSPYTVSFSCYSPISLSGCVFRITIQALLFHIILIVCRWCVCLVLLHIVRSPLLQYVHRHTVLLLAFELGPMIPHSHVYICIKLHGRSAVAKIISRERESARNAKQSNTHKHSPYINRPPILPAMRKSAMHQNRGSHNRAIEEQSTKAQNRQKLIWKIFYMQLYCYIFVHSSGSWVQPLVTSYQHRCDAAVTIANTIQMV